MTAKGERNSIEGFIADEGKHSLLTLTGMRVEKLQTSRHTNISYY
jgi:hypothetical protein